MAEPRPESTTLALQTIDVQQNMSITNDDANNSKLIQCGACFRSFHTQAQFGQHSRICREGKAVIRHLIQTEAYKYSFIEKQTQRKLEIKTRFVVHVKNPENWKKISRQNGLYDGAIKKMLATKHILNVDIAVRQRKASGLIIANFLARNVAQNAEAIHTAKSSIEQAVDAVFATLPEDIDMKLHTCKARECQELVIRDTEGFCSRHRAQKYHKKSNSKSISTTESIQKQNEFTKCTSKQNDSSEENESSDTEPKQEHISTSDMSKDDEIVAHILTSLRQKYHHEAAASAVVTPASSSTSSPASLCFDGNNLQLPSIEQPPIKKRKLETTNEWNSEVAPTLPYLLVPVPMNSLQFQPIQVPQQQQQQSVQFVPVVNVSNNYNQNNFYYPTIHNAVMQPPQPQQQNELQALIDLVKNTSSNQMNYPILPANIPPLPPLNLFPFTANNTK